MKVKPMLGDWEVPRIESIRTAERRDFAEFPVPGRVGSLFQDLNSSPTRIVISGSLYGDEARDQFLQDVRAFYKAGEPVTFVADILTTTEVGYVVIQDLAFLESADRPDEIEYRMLLQESPPPPPPLDPLGGLDAGLLEQAGGLLDTVTGALDAIEALGNVPDLQDPTPPLRGVLDGVKSALESLSGVTEPLAKLFGPGA